MNKIIPSGTEVLIFNYIREWGPNQNEDNFIFGTVIDSKNTDFDSIHGSPWNIQVYIVLGEDGKIYKGTYNTGIASSFYFRTMDDHIKRLYSKISSNCEMINNIKEDNYRNFKLISELKSRQKKEFKSIEEKTSYLASVNVKRYVNHK